MTDNELVRWFAELNVADPLPGLDELSRRLIRLGELDAVEFAPNMGERYGEACVRARDACRASRHLYFDCAMPDAKPPRDWCVEQCPHCREMAARA